RVGYGALSPRLVALLDHIKPPYNVNVAGLVAAIASLEDAPLLMERVAAIVAERERMAARLMALPFLRVYPSQANFLLMDVLQGTATDLKDFLASRGIFVRHYTSARLKNSLRISVGMAQHTDRVIGALQEWGAVGG
ncbi:MAG: aminotransferase class I/II-fold pyridoxal phosphate-dependent enzyme, partial [Chloroflexi bacterium]|nr:aminotransferase class I/II-fold pyridoxal phosphate-dependent enzyme [Chloroflexota bacterium]